MRREFSLLLKASVIILIAGVAWSATRMSPTPIEATAETLPAKPGQLIAGVARIDITGKGDTLACTAVATEHATGEELRGPEVTLAMAKKEGWATKSGSKWLTMPDLMIRYRAAAFWGRLYIPELLVGIQTQEEVLDIEPVIVTAEPRAELADLNKKIQTKPIEEVPSNDDEIF